MKYLFLFFLFFSFNAFAGNCTQTTRGNYNSLQVLKASDLNADFNQLVNKLNSFDGGCVTDGTLEAASLNITEFSALANGIQNGCRLIYNDANSLNVDKCIVSINGKQIQTTVLSNVTWGCTGCATKVNNDFYTVYISKNSTSSLTLFISNEFPGSNGMNSNGDKVVGLFYIDGSGNIQKYSVKAWTGTDFIDARTYLYPGIFDEFFFSFGANGLFVPPDGPVVDFPCDASGCHVKQQGAHVTGVTRNLTGTGQYDYPLSRKYMTLYCTVQAQTTSGKPAFTNLPYYGVNVSRIKFNFYEMILAQGAYTTAVVDVSSGTPQTVLTGVAAPTYSMTPVSNVMGVVHCKGYYEQDVAAGPI